MSSRHWEIAFGERPGPDFGNDPDVFLTPSGRLSGARAFLHRGFAFVALETRIQGSPLGHLRDTDRERADRFLRTAGRGRPVVVALGHAPGPEAGIDNRDALLRLLRRCRPCLLLCAGGASSGTVDGVPYFGVASDETLRVRVESGRLRVLRPDARPETVPSDPAPRPGWSVRVEIAHDRAQVRVTGVPGATRVAAEADGRVAALARSDNGWRGEVPVRAVPGTVPVRVNARLPDGRTFEQSVDVELSGPGAIGPMWRTRVPGCVWNPMASDSERVFVASDGGGVTALDRRSGRAVWKARAGRGASVARVGTVVAARDDAGEIFGCDARSGGRRWSTRGAAGVGRVWAAGTALLVSVPTGIRALDGATGRPLWSDSSWEPVAVSETWMAGRSAGGVSVRDVGTGRTWWGADAGEMVAALVGDRVYLTASGAVVARSAADGARLWRAAGVGAVTAAGPDLVVAGGDDGVVRGIDPRDGRVWWERAIGAAVTWLGLAEDIVFALGDDGVVCAVRTRDDGRLGAGSLLWRYRVGIGHLIAPPVVVGRDLVLTGVGGEALSLTVAPR